MVMAVVMGGAITAVAVTTMDGGAVVIAAGIKTRTQRGRLGWRPLLCARYRRIWRTAQDRTFKRARLRGWPGRLQVDRAAGRTQEQVGHILLKGERYFQRGPPPSPNNVASVSGGMVKRTVTSVGGRDRCGSQRNLGYAQERRRLQYRSGSGFRRRSLSRHPPPNAQAY